MAKWTKKSGAVIETNDEPATITAAIESGWKPVNPAKPVEAKEPKKAAEKPKAKKKATKKKKG